MKLSRLALIPAACALLVAAETVHENLVRNGDFEKPGAWRGEGRIVKEPGNDVNKVYEVALFSKERRLTQEVPLGGKKSRVRVSFRMRASDDFKSANPNIPAVMLRLRPDDRPGTFRECFVKKPGVWQTHSSTCECVGAKSMVIRVEIRAGSGAIAFDDFVLEAD